MASGASHAAFELWRAQRATLRLNKGERSEPAFIADWRSQSLFSFELKRRGASAASHEPHQRPGSRLAEPVVFLGWISASAASQTPPRSQSFFWAGCIGRPRPGGVSNFSGAALKQRATKKRGTALHFFSVDASISCQLQLKFELYPFSSCKKISACGGLFFIEPQKLLGLKAKKKGPCAYTISAFRYLS